MYKELTDILQISTNYFVFCILRKKNTDDLKEKKINLSLLLFFNIKQKLDKNC